MCERPPPPYGHEFLEEFFLDQTWTFLNHGDSDIEAEVGMSATKVGYRKGVIKF